MTESTEAQLLFINKIEVWGSCCSVSPVFAAFRALLERRSTISGGKILTPLSYWKMVWAKH